MIFHGWLSLSLCFIRKIHVTYSYIKKLQVVKAIIKLSAGHSKVAVTHKYLYMIAVFFMGIQHTGWWSRS